MARQLGGHPAKQDPEIAKLFRTMRSNVELVQTLDGRLSDENSIKLKAAALGLMWAYAELTGLPEPDEAVQEVFKTVTSS